MPAPHVEPLTSLSATRAKQAMADYKAGLADEGNGRQRAIAAVIEYGRALIEEKKPYGENDKAFGQWIKAQGLDQGEPWNVREERSKAMEIARLSTVGSVPTVDFTGCPNTRPIDIMKWYRTKTNPKPHKPKNNPKAPATAKATEAIRQMEAAGIPVTEPAIIARTGVADGTANKALSLHRREREIVEETLQRVGEDQAIAASLTPKQKLKLDDAIRIHTKRLDKIFDAKVFAEVRRQIDKADDHVRKHNAELRRENADLERLIRQRGVFTRTEYKQLQMCVHPDNTASAEVRNRLIDIIVKNELHLVRDKD